MQKIRERDKELLLKHLLLKHLFAGYVRFHGFVVDSPVRNLRNKISHAYDHEDFRKKNHYEGTHQTSITNVLYKEKIGTINLEEICQNDYKLQKQIIEIATVYTFSHFLTFTKEVLYSSIPRGTHQRNAVEFEWLQFLLSYEIVNNKKTHYSSPAENIYLPIWARPLMKHSDEMNKIFKELNELNFERKKRYYNDSIRDFFVFIRHYLFKLTYQKEYHHINQEIKFIQNLIEIYGKKLINLILFVCDNIVVPSYKNFFHYDFEKVLDTIKTKITKINFDSLYFPRQLINYLNERITQTKSFKKRKKRRPNYEPTNFSGNYTFSPQKRVYYARARCKKS